MNTTHILQVAGKYISGISEVRDNIFKGTLTVANKLAGVYYFDINNKSLDDFDTYQEALLADDFFAYPGNLQWNYYLFLLNDQLNSEVKQRIENNDKYARKYVMTESEFDDFFNIEKSNAEIRPNIIEDWKRRLDEVGLQDVYSKVNYVDLVAKFKASGKEAAKSAAAQRTLEDSNKIEFINRLILKSNYRSYPSKRDYSFGRVNLFRGINGVGKTSLFEAIEAMICGRCLRNPSVTMPQGCIEAQYNGNSSLTSYDGLNNRQYIGRDLNWYATNSRTNTLYNSFNRFNFFNADSAHSFSIAETEKEASAALFSIILGPEYHYISERNAGTLDRLRPEFNRLKEEMQTALLRKQKAERLMQNYKEPVSLSQLRETIQSNYRDMHFKNAILPEDLVVIEERDNQLRPILSSLLSKEASTLTLTTFNNSLIDFDNKRKAIEIKEEELRGLTEKQTTLIAKEKRLNIHHEFLSRCIVYVQDKQLMSLDGLQSKESEANLTNSKISFVKSLITGIEEGSDAIKVKGDKIQAEIDFLKAELKSNESEMTQLVKSLSRLDTVLNVIKSHGKEFMDLEHDATHCPLCQAAYDRSELKRRISNELKVGSTSQPVAFDTLRQTIETGKKAIQERELLIQAQVKVIQAFNAVYPGESYANLAVALDRLQRFIGQESIVTQELHRLSELKKYAEMLGRSEKEYTELKFACDQNLKEGPAFAQKEVEAFHKLLNDTTVDINSCKTELETTLASRTRVGNEIKRLLGVEGTALYLKDIREIFQKEETTILALKNLIDKLCGLVDLDPNSPISLIFELSETLKNNILSMREELKVQFEYDTARKELDEASSFISANAERLQRYKLGVDTLRNLTGDEATAHVSAFFNENFLEIVDIFKSIHVPREFKTLKYVNDRLELITDKGEIRTVSQISTGQRSALALSIFLSLNGKLKNGPDLIMFDDPIAFTDDLNALSFLDYLRLYTLKTGKQIFFATANMRLAGLFEKKFGFLEEGFKNFELTRN
jgi:exonuclease SbcC